MAQKHFYKVIQDCNLDRLELEVTALLEVGYELVGGITLDHTRPGDTQWYLQTLVKHT